MTSMVQVEPTSISNNFETALDFSSRLLVPFQDSDTKSLTFGLVALVLSAVVSWAGFDGKEDTAKYTHSVEENDIMGRPYSQIRNNIPLFKYNATTKGRTDQKKKNEVTFQDYDEALNAFESFMKWSKNVTDGSEFLEDLMELGLSKAKGKDNPADEFYFVAKDIVWDIQNKIYKTFDYYF